MTDEEETKEYDLTLKEKPIRLKDPKTGQLKDYILREIDGEVRDQYTNFVVGKMRFSPEGKPAGVRDMKGVQSLLISKTLVDTETGKNVTEAFVNSFPSSIREKIFKDCKEVSSLDDDAKDNLGNG